MRRELLGHGRFLLGGLRLLVRHRFQVLANCSLSLALAFLAPHEATADTITTAAIAATLLVCVVSRGWLLVLLYVGLPKSSGCSTK